MLGELAVAIAFSLLPLAMFLVTLFLFHLIRAPVYLKWEKEQEKRQCEVRMIEAYYKPNEIWQKWSGNQVKWLIPYLPLLRSGVYPRDPAESGYTDASVGKRQIRAKAPFITAGEIAGELDFRLRQCKEDGLFLEMVYSQPDDTFFVMQHIASALGVEINTVEGNIHQALRYVCGRNRKRRSFNEWKNHKGGKE